MTKQTNGNPWLKFHGPNLGYVIEQYDLFLNGEAVEAELQDLFTTWGAPPETNTAAPETAPQAFDGSKLLAAARLLDEIRSQGHVYADLNPLERTNAQVPLNGLSEADLKAIPVTAIWHEAPQHIRTAWDAVLHLQQVYTSTLAFEFAHVQDKAERTWLQQQIETIPQTISNETRIAVLKRLTAVEGFEQFLHKTFVGQKRFSIEGVDMLVPMMDELIAHGAKQGVQDVVIGMAHRGRLSVLAHVLEKPYNVMFTEFQNSKAQAADAWTGDVKYHLGKEHMVGGTRVTLANNPSHLEFVDPVVEGFARAAQENREKAGEPTHDVSKAFAILVHGDAAFPGQGIVAETLNLGRLNGYRTGGTIHIIANNMVGFTTDSYDSRSTRYASDLAKGFDIPIIHVNADDPDACLQAASLAYRYRETFQKDFVIDLVGYRRYGHNEMDDPAVTQPLVYKKVSKHPTVRALYAKQLQESGVLQNEEIETISAFVQEHLKSEYALVGPKTTGNVSADVKMPDAVANGIPNLSTSVPAETLREINAALLDWPSDFRVYPKVKKILERREQALAEGKIEWAHAEALAYATILQDGTPIRLTGQDSQRGTFAHRHIMLHDTETNETYSPLHRIPSSNASFTVHNSPLSEAAVVGFEYGYNVFAPETLVLWEAQYGDFANTAQGLFDQFVSASRAKWGQKSGLVILLPHGYEGQGPEHSSARPERFLQLAAENNWTVANLTSAAQYFHILRRQAMSLGKDYVRPLIIMTPKSLLRNPLTTSPAEALSEGKFEAVLEQPGLGKTDKVKRLVLTTGKMAIDLAAEVESNKELELDELHIVRVEELYPFPKEKIEEIMKRYPNLTEIVWVQEEPRNMGAWHYLAPTLFEMADGKKVGYIGRPDRSSPSGGDPYVHKAEQDVIISCALRVGQTEPTALEKEFVHM
ncbi:2-oxoglutarate dehydrogenase E1 component [Ectobacillus antri]|jgi:2-oxoglutarate dehydrogenase E1 component|uniref:2-oxoglutarate dehydrogenase E1 component n=1 Tax=Ectobacillus antri TaxID=2486280 RepID=A0ABT6H373_9BACI|nr:2-oxoglutarate dehydrogenase E1 component [Ectobacillus antri]MDG4657527.1 2-oxoglutarate dehydrogenase E1 component [Ectobacillus antri]MDG5753840.1 2-oxoglutarate dehydrogenase E1 component [Ectobacillus antri]